MFYNYSREVNMSKPGSWIIMKGQLNTIESEQSSIDGQTHIVTQLHFEQVSAFN